MIIIIVFVCWGGVLQKQFAFASQSSGIDKIEIEEQRKVIYDNYGQWNEAKVAKVKKVYHELKLYEVFDSGRKGCMTSLPTL